MADIVDLKIQSVWPKFNLGSLESFSQITGGVVNPCFLVNNEWILRFNERDKNIRKFSCEKVAYQFAAKGGVPVPSQVHYLFDDAFGEMLVTNRVQGQTAACLWPELSVKERERLGIEIGAVLKKVHSIEISYFGDLANEKEQFMSWHKYLFSRLDFHFKECLQDKLVEAGDFDKIVDLVNEILKFEKPLKNGCLVHRDFHFGNILVENLKVVAVVDWEWSFSGDPACDFLKLSNIDGECEGGVEALIRGYGKIESSHSLPVYQLINLLEMYWVSHRYFAQQYEWGKRQLVEKARQYGIVISSLSLVEAMSRIHKAPV